MKRDVSKHVLRESLWECYGFLQKLSGLEGDDLLTGHEERLNFRKPADEGRELKRKIRNIFELEHKN